MREGNSIRMILEVVKMSPCFRPSISPRANRARVVARVIGLYNASFRG